MLGERNRLRPKGWGQVAHLAGSLNWLQALLALQL